MAPVSDRNYFPSLEESLAGERVLLSWKLVAAALSDSTGQRQRSAALIDFFDDDYVHQLLNDPTAVFPPRSDSAQQAFETKTAPINITPAQNSQYDVKVLKEDADWLSKNANLSQVAALRIAVIEQQTRASSYLTGPLSSQDATNLQEAAGLSNGQGAAFFSDLGAGTALDADEIFAEFEKPNAKRQRLVNIYLAERRYFSMANDYAYSMKVFGRLPFFATATGDLAQVYRLKFSKSAEDNRELLISRFFRAVKDSLNRIESGLQSFTDESFPVSDELELEWVTTCLTEAAHALSVSFQLVDSFGDVFVQTGIIREWFTLMDDLSFFEGLQPINDRIAELLLLMKTLASAISIVLLNPSRALNYLHERDEDQPPADDDAYESYLFASDVLEQIHQSITKATGFDGDGATPAIFTWSLILHQMNVSYQARTEKRDHLLQQKARETFETGREVRTATARRNSAGSIFSIESSRFDGFLENVTTTKDLGLAERLATAVTAKGRVFDVLAGMVTALGPSIEGSATPLISSRIRASFLELLKVSYPVIGYRSEPVNALLSLLSVGRSYWDLSARDDLSPDMDVLANMLGDDRAMGFYFQQALVRYPLEFLPFISLSRALCSITSLRNATSPSEDDRSELLVDLLRRTPTLTFSLPKTFQSYESLHDDEDTTTFVLLDDIPLISLSSSWSRRYIEDDAYRIPAGTLGRFIEDTGRLVTMDYPHSGLALLGRQLEVSLMREGYQSELGMLGPDEVSEVISLLAALLRTEYLKAEKTTLSTALVDQEEDLLLEISKHISGGKDIVTVVCDTLDYYLQDELPVPEDAAVSVLNSCVKFLDSILPIHPSRVWSYLARSELLGSDSRGGKLAKITGSLDLVAERFDFLNSSLLFFSRLIETSLSSAVQRRVGNKTASRQRAEANPWLGTADKILSKVSFSIAQVSVDIFENTSTWKFSSETNRMLLLDSVVPILNKLVLYSHEMGDSTAENLTSALHPAASYIINSFISPATGTLRFQPLLSSFVTAVTGSASTLQPGQQQLRRTQITSVLQFSTTLLRVASYLEQSSSMLELYLFKCSTLLARLCAVSDYYRQPALKLLEALVINAGKSEKDPPSLLGYLGPQISKSFLQLLSDLGRPFALASDVKTTWKFFSSILRNRQQWMSNCLLTGKTPREAMDKESKSNETRPDSVFAAGLSKLKDLGDLAPAEALVILEFVASAQNYWPWTIFTLQNDTTYMDGLRAYVRDLKPCSLTVKSDVVRACQEARIAAYIAETFAMQLYHSRHLGNGATLAENLVGDLDYYLRDGVEVGGYNKSLHNNFERNFSNKYFGCSLNNFKRTLLEPVDLGRSYYYDLERANEMLKFDPGWLGRKADGFKAEMELANANLSLVDAQISLFHSWEFFLLELSTCLPSNDTIARQMIQVSQQCLNANQTVPGPESIFSKLLDRRANLSLVLIQRLVKASLPVSSINQLLITLSGTINSVEEPFASESIGYYRTLLKALFVTLRAYQLGNKGEAADAQVDLEESTVTITQTLLNLLDRVVGRGFRSLVSLIHDQDATIIPEDLALLAAILQACLSMPTVENSQTQILNIMAGHDVIHASTSLFSWADKLAYHGDPVYGELTIVFLMELSALPLVAEQLASDGILSSLLSANLFKFMLKADVSPYGDSLVAQRCYAIWVKGLLPLMLNLLASLGATIAPEVAYVLNQFPHLLQTSIERFDSPGASRTRTSPSEYITLLATSEIHSLALLTRIITALRVNNSRDIPDVPWDASGLLENVEFWLSSKRLLKERLLALGDRQVEWRGMKTAAVEAAGCENVLEAKVAAQLEVVRDVLSEEIET